LIQKEPVELFCSGFCNFKSYISINSFLDDCRFEALISHFALIICLR